MATVTNSGGGVLGSGKAIDGLVPGLSWADFTKQFGTPANLNGAQDTGSGAYVPGLGYVGAKRAVDAQNSYGGGEGGSAGSSYSYLNPNYDTFAQPIGDGTENVYLRDPNGGDGVFSKNQTINNDSWWDSTGLPLVASLAFGGATAGLSAAGVGVSGSGAGLANVGVGFGLDSAAQLGANYATNAASGIGGAGGIVGADGQTLSYAPYEDGGGFVNVGADAAEQAPSAFDSAIQSIQQAGGNVADWYKSLSLPERLGLSAGQNVASSALQGGSDAASSNPYSAVVQNYMPDTSGSASSLVNGSYDPTSSFINPTSADAATNAIASSGGSALSAGNQGGGLLGSIANLYNNGITSGSASDYTNILGGAGSLLNGVLGYNTAQNGINAQTNAANNSNALAAAIYANNTALAKPFVDGGTSAFNQQSNLNGLNGTAAQTSAMGQFKTDPGYQFALDQGNRGVQASAAAAGGLFSGRAAKDLTNYNQGMAAQQYGNYYNRLSGQAGIGQAAAAGQAAQGNNYVSNVTSNNAAIGNAQTAGGTAGTNAITGSIGSLLGQNSSNQLLNLLLKNQGSNGYYAT